MIPAWIWAAIVTVGGCIFALWAGSTLPDYDPYFALELVFMCAACAVCAASNNFPLLLALGSWIPCFPHFGLFSSLPALTFFAIWMMGVLFLRLCVKGYIVYRQSFNWPLLIIFLWVPVRFLMNPVTKLGATAGGHGVSGAVPYFNYCLAAFMLVFIGAILTDRSKIIAFLRWCFVVVLIVGMGFSVCAFIPASLPFLLAMGSFNAGDIGDGIIRLVQLPGYGLFLVQVSLCPALFRMRIWMAATVFAAGFFMIILGGNRSALAAAFIVIPVLFLLRRKPAALILSVALIVALVGALKLSVANMAPGEIPGLVRSFGVFDKKIDDASGGSASAQWRYDVWRSGINTIMQSPLTGKGFGNLPEHLDNVGSEKSTDFETTLAGGEAHNGFVTAAYGFGIPFMLALSLTIIFYLFKESTLALATDKHDPEMRDLHAFLACMFASYPLLIYSGFDLSVSGVWTYVAISCVLSHLPRLKTSQVVGSGSPVDKYGEVSRPAGPYSYPRR